MFKGLFKLAWFYHHPLNGFYRFYNNYNMHDNACTKSKRRGYPIVSSFNIIPFVAPAALLLNVLLIHESYGGNGLPPLQHDLQAKGQLHS